MLLILIVVAAGGCLAVLSSGGSGGSDNSGKPSYQEISSKAKPVGTAVAAGKVVWEVTNVQRTTELKAFGERKTGNFVIVDLTFKNESNDPVTLDSSSLAILDAKGRTAETEPDASMYVPTNKDLFLNQVNPGVLKQGRAIFDIAPDAKGLILRAGDTSILGDQNAYIKLGT